MNPETLKNLKQLLQAMEDRIRTTSYSKTKVELPILDKDITTLKDVINVLSEKSNNYKENK